MPGCDWAMKRFSVPMNSKGEANPCLECINNKYRGGDVESCDSCEKHNHFKGVDNGRVKNGNNNK
jgi:hypothetical protein